MRVYLVSAGDIPNPGWHEKVMYSTLGKSNNEQAAVSISAFHFLPFLRVAMSAQHILWAKSSWARAKINWKAEVGGVSTATAQLCVKLHSFLVVNKNSVFCFFFSQWLTAQTLHGKGTRINSQGKKNTEMEKWSSQCIFPIPLSSLTPVFDFSQPYINPLNICLSHLWNKLKWPQPG